MAKSTLGLSANPSPMRAEAGARFKIPRHSGAAVGLWSYTYLFQFKDQSRENSVCDYSVVTSTLPLVAIRDHW